VTIVTVSRGTAAARRCFGVGFVQCGAHGLGIVVLGVAMMAAGCAAPDWPHPARVYSVSAPVLVSRSGRVITGVGGMACGHRPLLVARSYPRKVTLKWVNPDTNCNAEAVRAVPVRIRLTAPLGNRALVHAVSGGPVRYFDERDLASLGALPAGYRLTSHLPSVSFPGNDQPWVVGDTRTYTGPAGTGTLTIAQLVGAKGIIPLTPWPWPGRVLVHGRVAALRVDQSGGIVFSCNITWVEHGYRFVVNSHGQVPLSTAQLTAVANGIRLRPG
jgi:hypothetical protein